MKSPLRCRLGSMASGVTAQETIVFDSGSKLIARLAPLAKLRNLDQITYYDPTTGKEKVNTTNSVRGFRFQGEPTYHKRVTIDLKQVSEGTQTEIVRFGEVLVDGDLRLIRVYLEAAEYDEDLSGIENYLYLLEREGKAYQLDLLSQVAASYSQRGVSTRYRNILEYVLSDCENIKAKTERLKFTDEALLALVRSCYASGHFTSREDSSAVLTISTLVKEAEPVPAQFTQAIGIGISSIGGFYFDGSLGYGLEYIAEFRLANNLSILGIEGSFAASFLDFEYLRSGGSETQTLLRIGVGLNAYPFKGTDLSIGLGGLVSFAPVSSVNDDEANQYFMANFQLAFREGRFGFGLRTAFSTINIDALSYSPAGMRQLMLRYYF